MKRIVIYGLLALSVMSSTLKAQTRVDYYYYHGAGSTSHRLKPGSANGYELEGGVNVDTRLKPKTKVCITVVNGHPINYSYSLNAAVDTSSPKLPDLSTQETLLAGLLGIIDKTKGASGDRGVILPGRDSAKTAAVAKSELPKIKGYLELLDTLAKELSSAKAIIKRSDNPESLTQLATPELMHGGGFRWAKDTLALLSTSPGHFNDDKLDVRLTAWNDTVKLAIGSDVEMGALVQALDAYSKKLLSERNQLRSTFKDATDQPVVCGEVGKGMTTFELQISKKDTALATKRTVGKTDLLHIEARTPYERSTIGIHPIAFAALASNVPEFAVSDGILLGPPHDAEAYRVGALINLNLANFGPDDALGVGFGLGIGTGGEKKVLSDFFLGAIVSLYDSVRFGAGFGRSAFPSSVEGGVVGQAFNLNGKKLEDLVHTDLKSAFHIIFVLPGLKLK